MALESFRAGDRTARYNKPLYLRDKHLVDRGGVYAKLQRDMVVHRHNLRSTLTKLCRLMSAGSATAKVGAERGGHLNGSSVDGRTIETLARASDVIDAEPVDDTQRVEMRQADKRDGDSKTRPPRDSIHS